MTQPESQLKRVHEKVLLLVKQYQALQKENERLKEDLRKYKSEAKRFHATRKKYVSRPMF